MTARLAHYWLNADGEVEMSPPAMRGTATPYLIERDGKPVLCVIEGGAYHTYEIARTGVVVLLEGAVEIVAREERRRQWL